MHSKRTAHDDDDSVAAGFARRDREMAGFPVGPLHPSQGKMPVPRAPRTDAELARVALATPTRPVSHYADLLSAIIHACATARAQGRAEAHGEAPAPRGTPPPPDPATPATADRERVAEALWRAWWRAHGESETEIQFPQLYESARNRWLEIADAGIRAMEEPR